MCLNTQFNCLVFVSKFDLRFCRSIGGTAYPVNPNVENNNLSTDKTLKNITKSHPKCVQINNFIFKLLFPNLISGFDARQLAPLIPSMLSLQITIYLLTKGPESITKSHPKFVSNKHLNLEALVSKFDLRFCCSIGGTTFPVNADIANNNLCTDKRPQKHHQKSSKNLFK